MKKITDIKWWHRIQLPNGEYTPGIVKHGPDGGDWPTTRFGMPEDLNGKRVIDIGCWDGFFSFEAEKRGASLVIASDTTQSQGGNWGTNEGFNYAHKALNSKVKFEYLNIEDKFQFGAFMGSPISPLEKFDVVMCYGVLYHLKSPLIAVEHLSKLVNNGGIVLVETAISENNEVPMLEYKPGFANDPTNYFYPNIKWLELSFKSNGAINVEVIHNKNNRAVIRATFPDYIVII